MVVILITVLFGPTTLVLTTDTPELVDLVERDSRGQMTHINLPDRMVLMANHQAYLDWMYIWILGCYSGNSRGIIILLKASLKKIPFIGWALVRCVNPSILSFFPKSGSDLMIDLVQVHFHASIMGG